MSKQIFLGDFAGWTDEQVRQHVLSEYGPHPGREVPLAPELLSPFDILVACEDSSGWEGYSFFLLRHRETGQLFENHASHCSCYGFEDQWKPELTTCQYLASDHFSSGCPDSNHETQIREFISQLREVRKS